MRRNNSKYLFIGTLIIAIGLIVFSYIQIISWLLIISVLLLVFSVIGLVLITAYNTFQQDKVLDIVSLKKQGLTITTCKECHKDNVLEDQYCIYCGHKLGEPEDGEV